MKQPKLIVYADLNCPFCFALHETLLELNHLEDVDWRLVQHDVAVQYNPSDFVMHEEIIAEVSKVRQLSRNLNIVAPKGRANTREAIEWITELEIHHPEKARQLRTELYRSYWQLDSNISDPYFLSDLIRTFHLPIKKIQHQTKIKMDLWQYEWENGPFERNIPAILNQNAKTFLGLPTENELASLISDQSLALKENVANNDVCELKNRPHILIAATMESHRNEYKSAFGSEFDASFATDHKDVIRVCKSDSKPDLVIMQTNIKEIDGFITCKRIIDLPHCHNIPVILISSEKGTDHELLAFEMGAKDYLTKPVNAEILYVRANAQLKNKRIADLLASFSNV